LGRKKNNKGSKSNRNGRDGRDGRDGRNVRDGRNASGGLLNIRQRKKYCFFCKENIDHIDYKNASMLERFISDKGKIRPKRSTGNCVQHQRKIAMAIKRSRVLALIPYYKR
jgi:small subunit ribosomal protein S18